MVVRGMVLVATLLLAGCSTEVSSTTGASVGTDAVTSTPSRSNPPTSSPSVSPILPVTPSPVPLTGKALRDALLGPSDLGSGWKVTKRTVKASDESEMEDYSPECVEFVRFWTSDPITKASRDSAFVELAKGKSLGQRTVSVRIDPMPAGGFVEYANELRRLLDECPSIVTTSEGKNTISTTMLMTSLEIPAYEGRSVGFLGTINFLFGQFYYFSGSVPVGDQLLTVTTSWGQKSRKTFAQTVDKAVVKLTQAAASPRSVSVGPR